MHKDKEAVGFCAECGRGVCGECAVELNGTQYCQECKNKLESKPKDEYIVCESCGGQYKLDEGESLEDFDACECGGKLKSAGIIEETKGTSNLHEIADKLDPETVQKAKDKSKGFLENFNNYINWKAIGISTLILLILSIVYGILTRDNSGAIDLTINLTKGLQLVFLLALLGGTLTGYIVSKNNKSGKKLQMGILNGIITGFISATICAITISFMYGNLNFPNILNNLEVTLKLFYYFVWSWTYLLITIIAGAIGGFAGVYIQMKSFK